MRLATVKLRNKRTGEVKIINQTQYAMNIANYHDWQAISWRRGDAPDDLEEFMARQAEKELARVANPNHAASKDPERAYEARQGRNSVVKKQQAKAGKIIIP
jgi:hypothetical protein